MIYLIIDPRGQIVMSNAGHMSPIHKTHNSINHLKESTGIPLGIQNYDYTDNNLSLLPGEKLFLYSDGVSEALNSKAEFFDAEQMHISLQKNNADINSIFNDLNSFTSDAAQTDDITLVEIEKTS
jgi:sigma-B regulation protein RsbU (phosphoserine phosphatase)